MILTAAQLAALKADIATSFPGQPNSSDANDAIAKAYNLTASPDYWVWRSRVTRAELYNEVSLDGTTWDWSIYKAQGVAEQNAWTQMFMGDQADFSKANLRSGIGKIFGAANANTTHCLAIGRRKATRFEKVFAAGNGATSTPSTMAIEGAVTGQDIENARNSS